MIKIAVSSDIHLEFGDLEIENTEQADVLILGGDICVANDLTHYDPQYTLGLEYKSNRYHDFFKRCSEKFPHVIYILGNHEHYHGDFAVTAKHMKEVLGYLKNIYILDNEVKTIDDVTFIGGTLWTDMNKEDPNTLYEISRRMNDFICVKNSNRVVNFKARVFVDKPAEMTEEEWSKADIDVCTRSEFKTRPAAFSPEDAVENHKKFLSFISSVIEGNPTGKFAIIGHHAPSKLSTHPRYKNQSIINGGYSSSLEEFIMDRPQIKLWTHGHTHEDFDYMLGSTRIVCNPRGYIKYEAKAEHFKLKFIEV